MPANPGPGGKLLPIEMDMLARATGQTQPFQGPNDWFGPGQPMPTQAPETVRGRQWDFPFAVNTNPRPRGEATEKAIDFDVLRRVADPAQGGLDLLRLAIETRKDQMAAQKWSVRDRVTRKETDDAKRVRDLLDEPDGVHDFATWSRLLMEDHLVIDQPVIYLRKTTSGYFLPEVMDGGLMKRYVAPNGRTPLPPLPAFGQMIKGLPAVDYTMDELIVRAYNPRTNRLYGMSPVEQVVNIINMALRRMLSQTEFYSAGTIPDGLLIAPDGMQPDQIRDFQDAWDAMLSGNTAARRHGRWVPKGTEYIPTKEPDLTGAADEWLARVICWCFSLSPQALVKEVNRATAQTGKQTAQEEGLEPRKDWLKGLVNSVIRRAYLKPDLEFAWQDEEITDPLAKQQVWCGYKTAGVVTADEVRDKALGLDPMSAEQKAEVAPPPPPMLGEDGLAAPRKPGVPGKPGTAQGEGRSSASGLPPASGDDKAAKVEKKKRSATRRLKPIKRRRPAVRAAEKAIKGIMAAALASAKEKAVWAVQAKAMKVQKASADDFDQLWDPKEKAKLQGELADALGDMAQDAADAALSQVSAYILETDPEADLDAMLKQANERAIAWADDRAAELVTQVDDTTRSGIRDLVEQALADGLSNDELADRIGNWTGFDEDRALMIARTETAFADVQGNLAGWKQSGVVEKKQWILGADACDECQPLADLGPIPVDEEFPDGGGDGPPLHPNCRCDLVPVLAPTDESDE